MLQTSCIELLYKWLDAFMQKNNRDWGLASISSVAFQFNSKLQFYISMNTHRPPGMLMQSCVYPVYIKMGALLQNL